MLILIIMFIVMVLLIVFMTIWDTITSILNTKILAGGILGFLIAKWLGKRGGEKRTKKSSWPF